MYLFCIRAFSVGHELETDNEQWRSLGEWCGSSDKFPNGIQPY
jgi:hypothetical protein